MEKVVNIGNIKEMGNDFEYWQSQSYERRLETIEQIRKEYNSWKYDTVKGLQRVFKVIKLKQC
ncbi:MAG: hypothetical protein KAH33_01165 [Candidatus Delongbacteria bacterium]|nr:hypothetical protein [Candidatus Delongbacteria bacterium]